MNSSFKKTNEIFQKITQLFNKFETEPAQNDETTFSLYQGFINRLEFLTPNYYLNLFKSFEILYSIGNSYFVETLFVDEIEKQLQEKNILINKQEDVVLYTGRTIKEILNDEKREQNQLPRVIEKMIHCMYEKGCYCKGIFRESQNASIRKVEELYMRMSVTNFEDIPVDVIANVLKKFLRNLPIHIIDNEITQQIFCEWSKINKNESIPDFKVIQTIQNILSILPIEHQTIFKELMKLSYKIISFSDLNSMNSKNLSVCLSTNLMTLNEPEQISNTYDYTNEYTICIDFISFCISNYPLIFPNDIDEKLNKRRTYLLSSEQQSKLFSEQNTRVQRKKTSKLTDKLFKPNVIDGPKKIDVFDRITKKQQIDQQQNQLNSQKLLPDKGFYLKDDQPNIDLSQNVHQNFNTTSPKGITTTRSSQYNSLNSNSAQLSIQSRSTFDFGELQNKQKLSKTTPIIALVNLPDIQEAQTDSSQIKSQDYNTTNNEPIDLSFKNPELSFNSIDKMIFEDKPDGTKNNNQNEFIEITKKALDDEKKLHQEEMKKIEKERRLEELPPINTTTKHEQYEPLKFTYNEAIGTYTKSNPIFKD
ncbi:hypothetical protein, conserved [Entamoeba dispar SAW760]|uniref:Rho-GAP domain-containing protein n=1 Tax=Entamoeba dispar (strain ATCC PRA-260 / SAW760) TaxID=370354 RepID=B0E7Q6_ENTDS|nr:uncharacterized protein EDI_325790 [Entamoeba dispar SAW760]EDR29437.1 hypothetical protein, conserved [Entamoeba dispar SAW760]|eukprot:EDR29437.1 hypothetical protein, conserved [Entamoeba dispar SAW760]